MLIKRTWLAASIVAVLGAAGATAVHVYSTAPKASAGGAGAASGGPGGTGKASIGSSTETMDVDTKPYIVVLDEAPLATYRGEVSGLPAPARMKSASGSTRINVKSAEARRYVQFVQKAQADSMRDFGRAIGRPLRMKRHMQHAINAVVTDLTEAEAARIARQAGVKLVEAYREDRLASDVGPNLIGAPAAWNGTGAGPSLGRFQGEGVVVGIIDSGINFGSPSFAAVDPVDGYRHVNERGAGNYLGTCAPGGVDAGRCNDKLIGGYDFVCDVAVSATQTICTDTVNYREEPGFGDTNNHGTHVASTAAGNRRDVVFRGNTIRISGVAPRANIVAYDACYTSAAGQGLCPNVSTLASINQAVADGIVDVINYSIGGGTNPWGEAISQAFLNATDAGIYVAAAAGNSGPGASTTGHHQPWVGTTAAAQHGRGDFVYRMDVTGPGTVPAALQGMALFAGSNGVSQTSDFPASTPLRVSTGIDTTTDGCAAFPAGTFTGAIAVIRRGGCDFSVKVNNASAAGAVAVIIANNQPTLTNPSVPGTTVPAYLLSQGTSDALRNHAAANGNALTVRLPKAAAADANRADQLAAFSSRGPLASTQVVKPDVTAPGVSVLAAIAGPTLTGHENAVGLLSGTSMASPHHAGAAAIIKQAKPAWTPAEIKSALMMTAVPEVLMEDGTTRAHPFAAGSGRIRVDLALRSGLVLNETKARYLAANPAAAGNPAALNLPNLINASCASSCTFERTFRSVSQYAEVWDARVEGLSGSISPSRFTMRPGETRTVRFTISSAGVPANSTYHFGQIKLTPMMGSGTGNQVLRMPVAIAVRPPALVVPASISVSAAPNTLSQANVTVGNTGGSALTYSFDRTGSGVVRINAATVGSASGFRSTRYTDAPSGMSAQFAADDFTLGASTRITRVAADGFVVSALGLASVSPNLTWSIYPDAGGVPAGNPETAAAAAVWTYTAPAISPGVTINGGSISLNLATAGQVVNLPPGKYWLVVNTRSTFANRWAWYQGSIGNGSFAALTLPGGTWALNATATGLSWAADGEAPCLTSWITAGSPASGSVAAGGSAPVALTINTNGLAAGSYAGHACFASNDPARPRVAIPVTLTVAP
jgi:subtilisin family serine protease